MKRFVAPAQSPFKKAESREVRAESGEVGSWQEKREPGLPFVSSESPYDKTLFTKPAIVGNPRI